MKKWLLFLVVSSVLSGCESSKVHNELKSKDEALMDENRQIKSDLNDVESALEIAQRDLSECRARRPRLERDTARLGREVRRLADNYDDLNKSYEFLLKNNNELLTNSARENKAMLERLQELDMRLQDKKDSLDTERENLIALNQELNDRSRRVQELERIIGRKDSTVSYILGSMKDALGAYEGKGLSVEERDGKVYVSLENSLLFPSASWTVNRDGKEALKTLAEALAANPDLQITVEGHTDDDAFRGRTAVKDNWDLSVMRATAVIKELTENEGVDPQRIIASGRSEYYPLVENDSPENKAINRRTEVIITPDLSELNALMTSLEGQD
jgi:chemotaxis protein MotB